MKLQNFFNLTPPPPEITEIAEISEVTEVTEVIKNHMCKFGEYIQILSIIR